MKRILCIGGNGFLGRKISQVMTSNPLTSIDFTPNTLAESNILLTSDDPHIAYPKVLSSLTTKFDSIFVTAGGWVGGSIKDPNSLDKLTTMNKANLFPSLLAAHIATNHLNPNGLIVFTGAAAVFKEPQPDMIAYALAKTGVHSLAHNLAQSATDFKVITILPQVIDTEQNTKGMPNADHSSWVKGEQIAQLLKGWMDGLNVPNNGAFVLLQVKNGCLMPTLV